MATPWDLCALVLALPALQSVLISPESISCKFTGVGYYLELGHKELPADRVICDSPSVTGLYQEQEVGFIVFIEDSILCLECYSYGNDGVNSSIRNGSVAITMT